MGLVYLVFENCVEVLDTATKAFLQEQQGICACRLDSLLVSSSIIAFAKLFASNHKLANHSHVSGCWQIVDSINQFLRSRNKRGRNLSRLAMTLTLEHQYLQAGTSCTASYSANKKWGRNKSGKYSIDTLQAVLFNKHMGVCKDESAA